MTEIQTAFYVIGLLGIAWCVKDILAARRAARERTELFDRLMARDFAEFKKKQNIPGLVEDIGKSGRPNLMSSTLESLAAAEQDIPGVAPHSEEDYTVVLPHAGVVTGSELGDLREE